ncbi:MAG: AsmA-like C-terminal region-containing protein [Candidatus Omnitrophica bacterium]|nr:AsmA-like C-terminal region-containing protein [Candidatus Omnitrophota bacterium]
MIVRKKLLKIGLVAFIFVSLFFAWYINKFLAPAVLKNFFVKSASEAINRPVSLESVRFSLVRGFVLNKPVIFEPDGKTVFIKADAVSTSLLLIPLLKEKKIIIPSIHISSPSINIIKNADHTWNFLAPPLIPLISQVSPVARHPNGGFGLLIKKIQLDNGNISYLDNTMEPAYSRRLINIAGEAAFSLKENAVNFKIQSQLESPLKTGVGLSGSYLLNENTLTANAALKNLALLEPYEYLSLERYSYFSKETTGFPIVIKDGVGNASIDIKMDRDRNCTFGLDSSIINLDSSGLGMKLMGGVGIKGIFYLKASEPPQLNYRAEIELQDSSLRGVYILNEITGLKGKIEISNDSIGSAGLQGYVSDMPVRFNGGLDLKNMVLKGAIESDLDLAKAKSFMPEDMRLKFKDLDLEGPARLNVKFSDLLKDPQPPEIEGKLNLNNVVIAAPGLGSKFQDVSGDILYKNGVLYIARTSFDYGQRDYILDAKIEGLESPDVKIKLKNQELSLDSRFQVAKDNVHVMRLEGRYLGSSFDAAGDIRLSEGASAAMRGTLKLDTADLQKFFKPAPGFLTNSNIKGVWDMEASVNGPLNKPKALEVAIKGACGTFSLWNLKLQDAKIDLAMKDGFLSMREFSARPYNGTLVSSLEVNLNQENPPYSLALSMEGVDLSKLILDTGLKDKKISGAALVKANVRGFGKNQDTIKGEGLVFISGGRLFEVPLLKGIADVLLVPNLSSIVFDEASMNFNIASKAVSTSDLKLHSQGVGLLGEGRLFFDGGLDVLVTTSFSENFVKGSSDFEKLANSLLAQAGQWMGRVKIGGTIKKPEYKFLPMPLDTILKDKLKELLGGFF